MSTKEIILVLRAIAALFLAVQVWVWLRYAGAFWLSDSLEVLLYFDKSVIPLRDSTNGFIILLLPTTIASFFIFDHLTPQRFVLASALTGICFSNFYLLVISAGDFEFFSRQIWVFVIAGSVGGAVYGWIVHFAWPVKEKSVSRISLLRRRLLGSVGVGAGATALAGSLVGPLYFWRNRNQYVEADLKQLKDNQLIALKVAGKPVWVLKRSANVLKRLENETDILFDPYSDESEQPLSSKNIFRSIKPEYLVVYGICTHLGCVPKYIPDGDEEHPESDARFFCPCHGGYFDLAGRVLTGTPPPLNLEVPNYEFVSEDVVRVYFPTIQEEWS